MQSKICSRCKIDKSYDEYSRNKSTSTGILSQCKPCAQLSRIEYSRTVRGLCVISYTESKQSARDRNHPMPTYTREELEEWMVSQPHFKGMFADWKESGYSKWQRPSVDRLDNQVSYTMDNIRLVTFKENNQRSHEDARYGKNLVDCLIPVVQYSLDGEFIAEYISMAEASKATGDSVSKICTNCRLDSQKSRTFLWGYKDGAKPTYRIRTGSGFKVLLEGAWVKIGDGKATREYLGVKDLAPVFRACKSGKPYRGNYWERY